MDDKNKLMIEKPQQKKIKVKTIRLGVIVAVNQSKKDDEFPCFVGLLFDEYIMSHWDEKKINTKPTKLSSYGGKKQ